MGQDFTSSLRPALTMTFLFALLLGILYPLAMTGVGQTIFPAQANGSLVRGTGGRIVGSALIGQSFAAPGYFHGRPSAAGAGYDGLASSGSNLGPASQALADRVRADLGSAGAPVPADLVTASGSGLDPHLSPEAALAQAGRVAAARGLPEGQLRELVARRTERPLFGLLGEPRVNVLALNQALDDLHP
ncbi:potassium-transporting ATPase subunit KdpC [Sphingosinicella sp. BN140058]|uniref:potassium-transporting ATPase subunit KdpC n=1 Tax=Sphingosinicella sp. BN140058 TaxID=1892855 RepID=UPI001012D5EC|nr:potassium-transporting ATPase subunit KdpC [Sphingosinicella sp. BN140058]QAY78391.1 potassium-transporting ATPase subunit KdpC [Sphingosinicella sp. BN140058]